mmetsp:Transcript_15054/g.39830  ORF Transcript_15054/g.39830 Transcript_15054/m.39830 type:complete len:293 (+) Transcript_15054:1027-1905(+)
MSFCTICKSSGRPSAVKCAGWCSISTMIMWQAAVRSSSSSSLPLAELLSSSSAAGAAGALLPCGFCSRLANDSLMILSATWQMCFTSAGPRMPGPARSRHTFTPSARTFCASRSESPFSSFGRMRFRSSCTSSCSMLACWPLRAQLRRWPQVSNAASRICSLMLKSKTGSRACAVCARNGVKCAPSFSAKVCMHSKALPRSSSSAVLTTSTLTSPSSPWVIARLRFGFSSSRLSLLLSYSFGASLHFARIPGSRCGTMGKNSSLSVEHNRSAAAMTYSWTGSSLGKLGTVHA